MFKKILLATDRSANSAKALEYAQDLAQKYNSELIVLNVNYIPKQFNVHENSYYSYITDMEDKVTSDAEKYLNQLKHELIQKNINVKTIFEKGIVGSTIVEKSAQEGCDIIVMGSRGLNSIERLLIGSVSNYVVHHAKCPVLLIH